MLATAERSSHCQGGTFDLFLMQTNLPIAYPFKLYFSLNLIFPTKLSLCLKFLISATMPSSHACLLSITNLLDATFCSAVHCILPQICVSAPRPASSRTLMYPLTLAPGKSLVCAMQYSIPQFLVSATLPPTHNSLFSPPKLVTAIIPSSFPQFVSTQSFLPTTRSSLP